MRMVRRCVFIWILIGEKSENWLKVYLLEDINMSNASNSYKSMDYNSYHEQKHM